MKRPTTDGHHGAYVTTPLAAMMMQLLGGVTAGPVALTKSEFDAIKKLYGFKPEKPNQKPPPPEPPHEKDFATPWEYRQACETHKEALRRHANWQDPQPMMQAGADRQLPDGREAREFQIGVVAGRETPLPRNQSRSDDILPRMLGGV